MHTKSCHREMGAKPGLFGLRGFEILILVATFVLWTRLFERPLRGLFIAGLLAFFLRTLRQGRLPGTFGAACAALWYGRRLVAWGREPNIVPVVRGHVFRAGGI